MISNGFPNIPCYVNGLYLDAAEIQDFAVAVIGDKHEVDVAGRFAVLVFELHLGEERSTSHPSGRKTQRRGPR